MKRAEVWTVAGGPDYAGKPRPAVILQDDAFAGTASNTTIAVGGQLFANGGMVVSSLVSGSEFVSSGGIAVDTVVSGNGTFIGGLNVGAATTGRPLVENTTSTQ